MKRSSRSLIYMSLLVCLWLPSIVFGEWLGPVDLFTGEIVENPVVGIDAAGNGVILASVSDGSDFYAKTAQLIQGAPANITAFPSFGTNQLQNAISVNANGSATAVWIELSNATSNSFLRSSILNHNAWSTPTFLSNPILNDVQSFYPPNVYLDSSNSALALWATQDTNYAIQENRYNSFWQGASTLFNSSELTTRPALAGSPSGQAIAIWYNDSPSTIRTAYFNGTAWNVTETIYTDVTPNGLPITAASLNASNQGIIIWINDSNNGLSSASFINGAFGIQQLVYAPLATESIEAARVIIDSAGNAIALWIVEDLLTATFTIRASRHSNGLWGTPTILESIMMESTCLGCPNIGVDGLGNAYAVWELNDAEGKGAVFYNYYDSATNNWLPASLRLSPSGFSALSPRLSMNALGGAILTWTLENFTNQIAQAVYIPNRLPPPPPPPPPPPGSPLPARHFHGKQIKNHFLSQTEFVNILKWSSSKDASIIAYNLSRNGALIASIPANCSLTYRDRDRKKNKRDFYQLTAVNAEGEQSVPLNLTLP
ncbi:hypothetical protein PNK_0667 [Candidatus Protochlamydia naegleriophila]|uniref:Uncharacterized protein n=1 Tax=Candidatus Protochlamydia naegleriophila TaxID=389348 RepID=A0A0U5JEV9_9BACT|nr:hypothetical protein [Candidatus Protochlamydia naegleriophila]CUI16294.1 hypothetical protein PNK_0667 [Candidatus Protochlamydia naegleriophila]